MNKKEFYARRRVYRIMQGQDNYEYEHTPSSEHGRYWSGMDRFQPSNHRRWDWGNSAVTVLARLKFEVRSGRTTKEEYMAGAPAIFKRRHPKVKLP